MHTISTKTYKRCIIRKYLYFDMLKYFYQEYIYYVLLLIQIPFLVNGLIARLTTGIQRKRVGGVAWMGYNLARTRKTGPLIFIKHTLKHTHIF